MLLAEWPSRLGSSPVESVSNAYRPPDLERLARTWNNVSYRTFRNMNGRHISMVVFDFDSTLVSVEGLDELFSHSIDSTADRYERIVESQEIMWALGIAGELSAEESLKRRLGVLKADWVWVEAVGEEIS